MNYNMTNEYKINFKKGLEYQKFIKKIFKKKYNFELNFYENIYDETITEPLMIIIKETCNG